MSKTLTERIEAAACDMSIDHDGVNSPADTLLRFLDEHGLTIVDENSERAAVPFSHGGAGGGDDDPRDELYDMLRNMCAAPVFWRSRAKALLRRIDGVVDQSPTVFPPEPES